MKTNNTIINNSVNTNNAATITIDQFNTIALKIQKATSVESWSWEDGYEQNNVWCSKNRAGQEWFYTTVVGNFGYDEDPTCEIIELGRKIPGFCGLPEFKPTFQVFKESNAIRITIDEHNLVAKLAKL